MENPLQKDSPKQKMVLLSSLVQKSDEGSTDEKNSPVLVQKTRNSVLAPGNSDHTHPQVDGEEEDLEENFR